MIDVADPIDRRHRRALVVRDRNERRATVERIERPKFWKVEPPVQRRDRLVEKAVQERIVQHVDMKVQNVELRSQRPHFLEHNDVRRKRIFDARVETQGHFTTRLELGGRKGISARK